MQGTLKPSPQTLRPPPRVPAQSPHKRANEENRALNQRLLATRTVPELLSVVESEGHRFNRVNATAALGYFVRLQRSSRHRSEPALAKLLDLVISRQHKFKARERGAIIRSLALLDLHHSALLSSLTSAPSQWADYLPEQIPSVLWALGRLSFRPPQPVVDVLLGHMEVALPHFDCSHLANCLWAFMRLGLPVSPELERKFLACFASQLSTSKQGPFTSVLYSLATIPLQPSEAVTSAALAHLDSNLHSFSGASLTVCLWSLNSLKVTLDETLLDRCFEKALQDFGSYSPQQRSMMVTSLQLYSRPGYGAATDFLKKAMLDLRHNLPAYKLKVQAATRSWPAVCCFCDACL